MIKILSLLIENYKFLNSVGDNLKSFTDLSLGLLTVVQYRWFFYTSSTTSRNIGFVITRGRNEQWCGGVFYGGDSGLNILSFFSS